MNILTFLMRPLLARGRDRLETVSGIRIINNCIFPYSLGDAIDWKPIANT